VTERVELDPSSSLEGKHKRREEDRTKKEGRDAFVQWSGDRCRGDSRKKRQGVSGDNKETLDMNMDMGMRLCVVSVVSVISVASVVSSLFVGSDTIEHGPGPSVSPSFSPFLAVEVPVRHFVHPVSLAKRGA